MAAQILQGVQKHKIKKLLIWFPVIDDRESYAALESQCNKVFGKENVDFTPHFWNILL